MTTVIFSAPQRWGKTRHSKSLMHQYRCTSIVDDWHPVSGLTRGALHLTNIRPEYLRKTATTDDVRIESAGWALDPIATPHILNQLTLTWVTPPRKMPRYGVKLPKGRNR